uniref:EF-hand domain-containing protein n=1 Tax=Monopterus albus TaxID=43700 RepID=A0A3Q3Q5T6_MONAL
MKPRCHILKSLCNTNSIIRPDLLLYFCSAVSPTNADDPAAVCQRLSSFDRDNDGILSFLKFWQPIGQLASKHVGFSQ